MAVSRRFRLTLVRTGLLLLGIGGGITYVFDPIAAQGFLLGGLAGLIGFWMMARSLEKLALARPEALHFAVLRWTFIRMGLYAMAFTRAFTLDREGYHGLLGAVAGFMVIRAVLIYLGITGRDLAPGEARDDSNTESPDSEE